MADTLKSLTFGMVFAVVVAAFFCFMFVVLIILCCKRRRPRVTSNPLQWNPATCPRHCAPQSTRAPMIPDNSTPGCPSDEPPSYQDIGRLVEPPSYNEIAPPTLLTLSKCKRPSGDTQGRKDVQFQSESIQPAITPSMRQEARPPPYSPRPSTS